jgi:hypothetical protein
VQFQHRTTECTRAGRGRFGRLAIAIPRSLTTPDRRSLTVEVLMCTRTFVAPAAPTAAQQDLAALLVACW